MILEYIRQTRFILFYFIFDIWLLCLFRMFEPAGYKYTELKKIDLIWCLYSKIKILQNFVTLVMANSIVYYWNVQLTEGKETLPNFFSKKETFVSDVYSLRHNIFKISSHTALYIRKYISIQKTCLVVCVQVHFK